MTDAPPGNAGNKQDTRFKPGRSGNPDGKPRGTRSKALRLLDQIGQDSAAAVLEAVIEQARRGDARCAEIVLRRCWPERRGRPVRIDLPELRTAGDLVPALAAVARAMAQGELSPEEAGVVAGVLEVQRKAIETANLEDRIRVLEQRQESNP